MPGAMPIVNCITVYNVDYKPGLLNLIVCIRESHCVTKCQILGMLIPMPMDEDIYNFLIKPVSHFLQSASWEGISKTSACPNSAAKCANDQGQEGVHETVKATSRPMQTEGMCICFIIVLACLSFLRINFIR